MGTKTIITIMNHKEKSESRLMLIFSMIVVFIGIGVLVLSPFAAQWMNPTQPLKIAQATIPSGYGICGIGILMLIIYRLPDIAQIFKGMFKK